MPVHNFNQSTVGGACSTAGKPTRYAYDRFGNLAAVTNALGNAIVYEYDLRGRKIYEGGATYPVRYTYDVFGNKVTMMTYRDESSGPDSGDVTTWLYDEASGVMTNKVYADGKGPRYDYDANGRLIKRTWARGIDTFYAYDGWGNLTNTTYSDDTPSVAVKYDALGRQVEARDAAGVTTFVYDAFGANTDETVIGVAGTNVLERFTDEFGRDVGYALNGIRQTLLKYDAATSRLTTMQMSQGGSGALAALNGGEFSWTYLPNSDLKSSLAYPNGLTASWTYDANNQLIQVRNATPTNVISQYDYTYDAAGRRTAMSKSGSAFEFDDVVSYGYNDRSELTNAVASVDTNYRYSYQYDPIGNRETSSERGTNTTYAANELNQYTAVDDFVPQFDLDGNQTLVKTATGIWHVTYNGENRPVLWTCGTAKITMSFDRRGRRVVKNDQRFVYDGYLQIFNCHAITTPPDYNYFIWDPTEPIATRPLVWITLCRGIVEGRVSREGMYYTHDGNKNVSEVIAMNGDIAICYEYAPFGVAIMKRSDSTIVNLWRFSSEHADDEIGCIYYNYREYGPVYGRWMGRDDIGDVALYLACCNRVVGCFDWLGLLKVEPKYQFFGENVPKGKWGVTEGVKDVNVTSGSKTFENGCCWFDVVPEFEIKLTVTTPREGTAINGIKVDKIFAKQTLVHENKHVAIVEGVAGKYLSQGEAELKQLKQRAPDEETCFMILDDWKDKITADAIRRYLTWEEIFASRLDSVEKAQEKFIWYLLGRRMRVIGDFDVQAALKELGD